MVLNHCATGSSFIEQHPEAAYNLKNSPYMRAAYELDKALAEFTEALSKRKVSNYPFGNRIENEEALSKIMQILRVEVIPKLKLHEYFQMDTQKVFEEFRNAESEGQAEQNLVETFQKNGLEYLIRHYALLGEGEGRFTVHIDSELVWKVLKTAGVPKDQILKQVKGALSAINSHLLSRLDNHIGDVLKNTEGDIRYHKIEQGMMEITSKNPLVNRYFSELKNGEVITHNGFIMGYNEVLKDFAGKQGWHYFRRNVVVWGDCVKLRYGNSYEDCPVLWENMEKYVTTMARIFKGLRLDNTHSTPIHVSEYLLKKARQVNPNLFVIAELFTCDEKMDAYFVKRIGLNCLVREAMQAHNPRHLGDMVYEYGNGDISSLGSLEETDLNNKSLLGIHQEAGFVKLVAQPVPAILYDCTHDNETPSQKRQPQDALPNAAVVCMTNSSIASTRGYDELIPRQLSVVTERRLYKEGNGEEQDQVREVNLLGGGDIKVLVEFVCEGGVPHEVEIKGDWDSWREGVPLQRLGAKRFGVVLKFPQEKKGREIPFKFVLDGNNWVCDYRQKHAKFGGFDNNVLVVENKTVPSFEFYQNLWPARKVLNELHVRMSEEGFSEIYVHQFSDELLMIIRQNPLNLQSYVMIARCAHWTGEDFVTQDCVKLPGVIDSLEFLGTLNIKEWKFRAEADYVNGLTGCLEMSDNLTNFASISRIHGEGVDQLDFHHIPRAFVVILKTKLLDEQTLYKLEEVYSKLSEYPRELFEELNLEQINHIIWRCGKEELDITKGRRNVYGVPGYHPFNYAGIGSLVAEFLPLTSGNKLGHQIFNNLREGNWLIDYTAARLGDYSLPSEFVSFVTQALSHIKTLPRGVVPKHFVKFIFLLFRNLKVYILRELYKDSKLFAKGDDSLADSLGLAATQFWGNVPSAKPHMGECTLSAGLPHFATEFMRVWGRDTFIALGGLLICTGRFSEAKETILTFASVMRHGLIPNLLDCGNNSRFNSRDATWFFLQSIQDYCKKAPEGCQILESQVTMRFKSDNQDEHYNLQTSPTYTLGEVVQKIMQAHASGIAFREWNAGKGIDEHMTDQGFNVRIQLHTESGILFGGNKWNCGTWMDKMGSSEKARNKGVPSTPRDGAPIELTGLLYSAVNFLSELNTQGKFDWKGVQLPDGSELTYENWASRIKAAFESLYFISDSGSAHELGNELINVTGIYKDTIWSELEYSEYQLRPNMCIAMAVAPGMFHPENAKKALERVKEHLLPEIGHGQLGIRTLNEGDSRYRGFYDNSNDSEDYSVAHGFSYHNGPEWLWPLGYYLRAVNTFQVEKPSQIMKYLKDHRSHLDNSLWISLPELTNERGQECVFSCPAQAWSVGTLLEVLYDLLNNY